MGIMNALRLWSAGPPVVPPSQLASPWADSSGLATVAFSALTGLDALPLTRQAAIRVPAVARARSLVAPTIARQPLTAFKHDEQQATPTWMHRTDRDMSPFHRMLWTVDDLFFHGLSLWRASRGSDGQLLDGQHVPFAWWDVEADGAILIQDAPDQERRPARQGEVILFAGPHEGILTLGADAIPLAAELARTALDRSRNPEVVTELHYTGDKPLTDPEIESILEHWRKARRQDGGSVGFTGKNVEVKTHGSADSQLLIEGQNAAAVDIARVAGLPASMIDATTAQASLTYETSQGRNAEFIDYGLAAYLAAIEGRLSADDVVPRGWSTRFDLANLRDLAPTPTGPATED